MGSVIEVEPPQLQATDIILSDGRRDKDTRGTVGSVTAGGAVAQSVALLGGAGASAEQRQQEGFPIDGRRLVSPADWAETARAGPGGQGAAWAPTPCAPASPPGDGFGVSGCTLRQVTADADRGTEADRSDAGFPGAWPQCRAGVSLHAIFVEQGKATCFRAAASGVGGARTASARPPCAWATPIEVITY